MSPQNKTPRSSRRIRNLSLSYNHSDSHASALRLVLAILPDWATTEGKVEFERFTDGITNTLLRAVKRRPGYSEEQIDEESVLLRAYGKDTEILIDREREFSCHSLLARNHLAPPLLARFQNGLLYKFIRGRVSTPSDLTREAVYRGVARRLGQWHAVLPVLPTEERKPEHDLNGTTSNGLSHGDGTCKDQVKIETNASMGSGKASPNVWTVMQKWILALPESTKAEAARKSLLQRELHRLVKDLSNLPGLGQDGLVFGHCDLLSGNVVIESSTNGATCDKVETVSFIDYEYATASPAAFDIANHFAEWGGFECDYNAMPSRVQRREFLREYLRSYQHHRGEMPPEGDEDHQLERLFEQVDLFRGVPGFYWGIWALIQATISSIDFDYATYAEVRLREYWDWKAEMDGSRARSGRERSFREDQWARER